MNIERFIKAQKRDYDTALDEIKSGKKKNDWMWYIFPQIKGLGESPTSDYYGLDGLDEAKEYLKNEYLRSNLMEISEAIFNCKVDKITDIMWYPDDLKLQSSMTIFMLVDPKCEIYKKVLDKYFDGKICEETLMLLGLK